MPVCLICGLVAFASVTLHFTESLSENKYEFTPELAKLIPTMNIVGQRNSDTDNREIFVLADEEHGGKELFPKGLFNLACTAMLHRKVGL